MVDYFETTDRTDEYQKMSDYEKGYIDGVFYIASKMDTEYRPFIADTLSEYIESYLEETRNCPPDGCDSLRVCRYFYL